MLHLNKRGVLFLPALFALSIAAYVQESKAGEVPKPPSALKASAGLNVRLRNEFWDTFQKENAPTDETYNLVLSRVRGFTDVTYGMLTFHMMFQFISGLNIPDDGAFGPGPTYFAAGDDDDNLLSLQLVEVSLQLKDFFTKGLYLKAGRIGIQDGAEVMYGKPKIDWIKRFRLSERLVGNVGWSNVERRYDGGTVGYANKYFDLNVFGASVLEGVFDFDDGYEHLDKVAVAGATLTLKQCAFLPNTEVRLFDIYYFDSRDVANTVTGDDIKVNTAGASIVGVYDTAKGQQLDLMLWGAYQFGDFGDSDQQAFGLIGEVGYQFMNMFWKPWLRLGVAYASGDDDPDDGDHESFFNLVPTNHKYYGYADAFAFSNLQDYYFQFMLTPHPKVNVALDGHLFRLASDDDFWTAGTGAFNNKAFGYTSLVPVAGEEVDKDMGTELDLTVSLKPTDILTFDVGYSHIFGGDGVEAVFDDKQDLNWFYVQAVVNFTKN